MASPWIGSCDERPHFTLRCGWSDDDPTHDDGQRPDGSIPRPRDGRVRTTNDGFHSPGPTVKNDGQRPDGSVPGERRIKPRSLPLIFDPLRHDIMGAAPPSLTASIASSSSSGSNIFSIFALLGVSLSVLLLLRYYLPLRKTPSYLLVPIFLALALPVSIILLVPIDLASSAGTDSEDTRGIWLPEGVILVAWRILYWLTFALTW